MFRAKGLDSEINMSTTSYPLALLFSCIIRLTKLHTRITYTQSHCGSFCLTDSERFARHYRIRSIIIISIIMYYYYSMSLCLSLLRTRRLLSYLVQNEKHIII